MSEVLTGKTRHRLSNTMFKQDKLILQVQVIKTYATNTDWNTFDEKVYEDVEWRDATVEDLQELKDD